MSEENNNQNGEIEEPQETTPVKTVNNPPRRRFFSRRNAGIGVVLAAFLGVLLTVLVVLFYRYGVFDNYVKTQFKAKMADIGVVFDADVFRVTVAPLQLELKNATFNDKVSGDKLFFIRDAKIKLAVQDLYAWQLSRDITVDTTDIDGAEAWVKFDENGKSNFSNLKFVEDKGGSSVNFKYDSIVFSLKDGLVHFGDTQHKISANAKNVMLALSPTTYAVPDEQKRYNIEIASTDSNFVYDERPIEPINVRAKGIADDKGAEISEFKLTTPIGESTLNGRLTDWEKLQYDLNIESTVDLTQTSNLLPVGKPLRGVANFTGKVTGEGENYRVEGKASSEALAAENIYLKGVNVAATVEGTNSMYEANGKAVAELLTFEDFKIDFPQIVGNIRGTGTDFRWVGELQAAAAKTPLGTLGGIFISDAVADLKDEQLNATLGNVRARSFSSPDADLQNVQTRNLKISSSNGVTDASTSNVRAGTVKTKAFTLEGVVANNVKVRDREKITEAQASSLTAQTAQTKKAKLKNLSAESINVEHQKGLNNVTAKNFRAEQIDATNGTRVADLAASDVVLRDTPNETVIFSNSVQVAKVETDAAILGRLNVAGVRLTIRQGRIEGSSGDINAGTVTLVKNKDLPQGGNLDDVKIYKPVFVLEDSGRYRATADMSLGGGVVGSIKLGAARANVTATDDQVTLNNLSADVMEGKLNGNATIALNNRGRSQVNATFSNLDLGKILALQGGRVIPIEGQTTGQVDLTFNGTNFKTASGNLVADITANAGTVERGLVPINGRVEASATNGLFNINVAKLNTEKSEFSATGRFDLNGSDSSLNLALNSADAGEIARIVKVLEISPELNEKLDSYQAEFAGNLKFNGTLTGNISDPTIDGRASLDSLILRQRDLGSLTTDIYVSPQAVELKNGLLQERDGGNLAFNVNIPSVGTDNISVQATLNKINTGNLLAALPIDTVPDQLKNFQAQTSGTINLTGLPENMQGEANISSGAGTVNGEPFDGFEARATFTGSLVNIENFNVRFGEGFLNAKGTYATNTKTFDFDVNGKDIAFARVRPFIPNSKDLPGISGIFDLQAKVTGTTSDSRTYNVNFNGAGRDVVFNENALGQISFAGKTENQQLNANLTANFGGQPQSIIASVNFADENLPFRAETTFNNTELAPFIALANPPTTVSITGTATGKVFLAGNLSSINPTTKEREFTTANLSGSAQLSQLALQIGDTPLYAAEPVSIKFNTQELVFESAKFTGGGSNIVVSGTKALTDSGVNNLAVDGKINLSVLNAISSNTFFAGLANVSVRLTGVNATARLNGTADLQNATAATFVGSERLSFDRIKGRILFTSNQAQIDELTGFLGGGKVSISGGAQLEALSLQAFRFNLTGNNITVPLPQDFITSGDAEIELTGIRSSETKELAARISGRINARRSLYTKDIDLADIVGTRRGEGSLEQGTGSSSSFFGSTQLDLLIEGRDALVVRNNLADLTASISLRVNGDIDYPQISGRVTANSGTILFRKDRYEVQRGELLFPPNSTGIEPIINLQAESEINGYQIFVNLSGNLADTDSLNASVRSNPALPQADVVSLITTGTLANSDSGIPTLAQSGINTATEILADEIINKPLSKATDKLFGLNKFEIDPIVSGQRLNPTARLTVGRQINRNLLVTYSTNLSEDQNQVLALEYRVSNRLSFVAQYEQRSLSNVTRNSNVFSFEIRLRKRF